MPSTADKDKYESFVEISTRERDKKKSKGNIYLVMVGCELQKFQGWLLEGLVATLTESGKDGNPVRNISLICCNVRDEFKRNG